MTTPAVQSLGADVSVAAQISPADVAALARAGFKSIVNNRPDFEAGPDQPTADAIGAAAKVAGLAYAHLPVSPAVQTADEIARFAELLRELPKPILAFCRSGTRSGNLYRAAITL